LSSATATITAALITAMTTATLWALEREGVIGSLINRTRFNITGKWVGWTIYLPSPLSPNLNTEYFFKVEVTIKQRGRRIHAIEAINEIYDIAGKKIETGGSRDFTGQGRMIGDTNVVLIFAERAGLTCAATYLVLDTWGRELYGILVARNRDGKPVTLKMTLVREGRNAPTLDELVPTAGLTPFPS